MTDHKITMKYCHKDYKNHHRWERIGCDKDKVIYQCSQCKFCCFEEIEILGRLKDA